MAYYRCGGGNGKIKINNSEEEYYTSLFGNISANNFIEAVELYEKEIVAYDETYYFRHYTSVKLDENRLIIIYGRSNTKVYATEYNYNTNEIIKQQEITPGEYAYFITNACKIDENKILLVYAYNGSLNLGARILTVTSTGFTLGTGYLLDNSNNYSGYCTPLYVDNGKVLLVCCGHSSSSYMRYMFIDVSNDTITKITSSISTIYNIGLVSGCTPRAIMLGADYGLVYGITASTNGQATVMGFKIVNNNLSYSNNPINGSGSGYTNCFDIVKVDDTTAVMYYTSGGSYPYCRVVSYNGVDSITLGTAVSFASTSADSNKGGYGSLAFSNNTVTLITCMQLLRKHTLSLENLVLTFLETKTLKDNGVTSALAKVSEALVINNNIFLANGINGYYGCNLYVLPTDTKIKLSENKIDGLLVSNASQTTSGKVLVL